VPLIGYAAFYTTLI